MTNKLIMIVLTITIGVILLGGFTATVFEKYTTKEYTLANAGMPFVAPDDSTHTITVDSNGAIAVDGVTLDLALFPGTYSTYTLVYSDSAFVRYAINDVQVQTRISGSAGVSYAWADGVTITINGDSATISNNRTGSSTNIRDVTYYISTEGDYRMALNPVVDETSMMYGAGQTYFGTSSGIPTAMTTYISWSGNLQDGFESASVLYWSAHSTYNVTISEINVDKTELADGVYKINAIYVVYDVEHLSTERHYALQSKYTYFLAPDDVTHDNESYIGDGSTGLIGAVMVVSILALLMIGVRAFTNRD